MTTVDAASNTAADVVTIRLTRRQFEILHAETASAAMSADRRENVDFWEALHDALSPGVWRLPAKLMRSAATYCGNMVDVSESHDVRRSFAAVARKLEAVQATIARPDPAKLLASAAALYASRVSWIASWRAPTWRTPVRNTFRVYKASLIAKISHGGGEEIVASTPDRYTTRNAARLALARVLLDAVARRWGERCEAPPPPEFNPVIMSARDENPAMFAFRPCGMNPLRCLTTGAPT